MNKQEKEYINTDVSVNYKKVISEPTFIGNLTFMKNDNGKNMLSLIEPQFVVLLGEILTFGANKYAKNNWKLCTDESRYKDALLRHIYAYLNGEKIDPESGLSHLGHAAFGLMALNYFDNINKIGEKK